MNWFFRRKRAVPSEPLFTEVDGWIISPAIYAGASVKRQYTVTAPDLRTVCIAVEDLYRRGEIHIPFMDGRSQAQRARAAALSIAQERLAECSF